MPPQRIESGGRGEARSVVSRPARADARRNFDALLSAARGNFAAEGADASLEGIARQAGVNIATLYRNFPTRQHLFETVYLDEVEALARMAAELVVSLEPWDALELAAPVPQLRDHQEGHLRRHRPPHGDARDRPRHDPRGGPPAPGMCPGRRRGQARRDNDVLFLVNGVSGANFVQEAQRDRVLAMALDGIKAHG
nr:helix-turn-helix domain-containing protein [Streptomyces liliiviolaceus]